MKITRSYFILFLICMLSKNTLAEEPQMEHSIMLGLRTVGYEVNNLDAAVEWYTHAFGIPPYVKTAEYVGFSIRGFELGLVPETSSSEKGNNVVAYWGVENVDDEYNRLIELGAKAHEPIIDVGGGIKLGTVMDPFGNILGVIYNPIFKSE